MNIGSVWLEMLADGLRFRKDVVDEATAAGDKGGAAMSQSLGASLQRNLKQVLGGSIGAVIGSFVAGATQEFAKFDDQMRAVFAILPGISKEAMDKMKADVLSVSKEYGVLTDDLVPALQTALGSGIPENNVMDFLRVAAKAAKAGASDTESSVKALAATINAFKLPVEDANKVADSFFEAIDRGVTTFPELAANMATVAPAAAALGLSFQDVLAAVTAMTLQGETTAGAITNISGALTALQKGSPEMTKVLKEMGYETGQAALDALGFQGTLEGVRAAADKLGVPLIRVTGRLEGANAILELTGKNAATAQDVLAGFGNTTGKVDAAFQTMEGGIGGFTRRTLASMKAWVIEFGEQFQALGPAFTLFGPTAGRAIGAGLGAAFGFIAPKAAELGLKIGKTIGSKLLDAIAPALFDIAGSQAVVAAGEKLGSVVGSTAGKAFGVAFGVAAVAAVLLVLVEIGDAAADQTKTRIRLSVQQALTTGTQEAIAGAEKEISQSIRAGRAGHQDWLVDYALGQQQVLAQGLKNRLEDVFPKAIADAVPVATQGGAALSQALLQGLTLQLGTNLANIAETSARIIGQATPHALAEAIRSRRGEVDAAWQTLLSTIKDNRGAEDAKVLGRLLSKTLAKALKSNDPLIRQTAKETRATYIERLGEIVPANGKLGKKARRELAAALDSKDPQIVNAAKAIKKQIEDGTIPKVKSVRDKTVDALTQSITAAAGPIGTSAYELGVTIRDQIIAGITGKPAGSHSGAKSPSGASSGQVVVGGRERRASGGPVAVGRVYQINERRQELFAPSVSGRMIDPKVSSMSGVRSGPTYDSHDTVTLQVGRMDRTTMPDTMRRLRRIGDVKRMRTVIS